MNYKLLNVTGYIITLFLITLSPVVAQNTLKKSSKDLIRIADSLYYAQDWVNAKKMYESVLKDTSRNSIAWNRLGFSNYNLGNNDDALKGFQKSLAYNPIPPVKASALSRMARVHALRNEKQKAITELDSAVNAGYSNLSEMDSLKDFNTLRSEASFIKLRERMYGIAYPCMIDLHAREFDFWAGEWDVYPTGTKTLAGQSAVQIISGGCALLENWTSAASTGKSINYIDPVTNKWKQAWAGSYAAGIQEFINGEYKDSAMRFVFDYKDAQGKRIIGRFIFYNEGPNQVRQFNETSADDGKTWMTSYDFTYVRKK
ncbi:MAG: tetratricopeptide repeat protein [Ginsengibacter sp.]